MNQQVLDDLGVKLLEKKEGEVLASDKFLLAVKVTTICKVQVPHLEKIKAEWLTRRGVTIHFSDFEQKDDHLSFVVSAEMHKSFLRCWPHDPAEAPNKVAMTFADYCHRLSDGTTQHSIMEVDTKVPDGIELGDLTWCLPSKFADDLIDALYVMNDGVLEGILEQAILVGPYVRAPLVH